MFHPTGELSITKKEIFFLAKEIYGNPEDNAKTIKKGKLNISLLELSVLEQNKRVSNLYILSKAE